MNARVDCWRCLLLLLLLLGKQQKRPDQRQLTTTALAIAYCLCIYSSCLTCKGSVAPLCTLYSLTFRLALLGMIQTEQDA
jgi:hypothetical protein